MELATAADAKRQVKEVYSADEAAEYLGVTARLVRHYCSQGRLGKRFGARVFLIHRDELEAFAALPRIVGNPGRGLFRRGPGQEVTPEEAVAIVRLVQPGDVYDEKTITERDIDIAASRAAGDTLQSIAAKYHLTRERIRQITSLVSEAALAKQELRKHGRVRLRRRK
jgi:excisionase family DNA binding protein